MAAGLDFRLLGQFLTICDAPNMATAARKMAVSAPAVSQIIRRIERELGVSVFERSSRGIRLTPAGTLLRQRARDLLEAEADTLEALAPYRNRLLPKLRVQIASTVANYIAPAIVAELNHVVGEIELKSGRVNQAAHDFLRGEFDILISSDDLPEISNLERFRLCRETLIGLVPTTVPKDRINLPWLATNLSMIRFGRGSQIDAATEAYLVKHGLNLPRPIECRTPAPAIELIAQGLGWLITTPLSVAYYLTHSISRPLIWSCLSRGPRERFSSSLIRAGCSICPRRWPASVAPPSIVKSAPGKRAPTPCCPRPLPSMRLKSRLCIRIKPRLRAAIMAGAVRHLDAGRMPDERGRFAAWPGRPRPASRAINLCIACDRAGWHANCVDISGEHAHSVAECDRPGASYHRRRPHPQTRCTLCPPRDRVVGLGAVPN